MMAGVAFQWFWSEMSSRDQGSVWKNPIVLFSNPWTNDTDEDGNGNGSVDAGEISPRDADSDNDSLSDGLEIGGWNISVYFEATGEKRSGYPIVVVSDAWDMDTDDDGLTDGQEFENATSTRVPSSIYG